MACIPGVNRILLLAVFTATAAPSFAQDAHAIAVPTPAAVPAQAAVPSPSARAVAKKGEYTGPNTIVTLPATPMLDEEGRQRIDPDGKPMWNAPVAQQRDRKGHPVFDETGKPIFQTAKDLGYDENGHRLHAEKSKPEKLTPVTITRGVMTVDGYTGKAALNYDIADLHYIYLYAPGVGIAVVSNRTFPGATEQPGAFDDKTLTVSVDGHVLQIAGDTRLLDKKPQPAYVRVDRDFTIPSRFPAMGYGNVNHAPYAWPGAKPNVVLTGAVQAPPVPRNMLPVQLLKPCPAGMMRPSGATLLPGQTAVEQPCATIGKSQPVPTPVATPRTTAAVAPVAAVQPAAVPVQEAQK